MIYFEALVFDGTWEMCSNSSRNRGNHRNASFLRTCRQIQQEATPIFYGENTISVCEHDLSLSHASTASFLNQTDDSARVVRKLNFHGSVSHVRLRSVFHRLKKMDLEVISFSGGFDFSGTPDKMAGLLLPWARALHKARKGTEKKQVMDVLQFVDWNGWPHGVPGVAIFGRMVKSLLADVLE